MGGEPLKRQVTSANFLRLPERLRAELFREVVATLFLDGPAED